jgi:membrane protease YdiL (CAAX protease family)
MERTEREGAGSAPAGLTAVAWLATALASSAGAILYRAWTGADLPLGLGLAGLALLAALFGLSLLGPYLRPLRGYLLALMAFQGGGLLADGLAPSFRPADWLHRMLVNAALQLIPCALLALTLVRSGMTRRDVFLAAGDMAAPAEMPFGIRSPSWRRLGPALMLFLAAGLSVQLFLTVRPDPAMLGGALRVLPWALAFAALNAAQEEFRYRAVLLARLVPSVGRIHSLLITSALFGLDHWFGHPSGPSGVLLAGFAGYLWGKSMIETRGSGWAWLIHAFQDVVIVLFIAAAHR